MFENADWEMVKKVILAGIIMLGLILMFNYITWLLLYKILSFSNGENVGYLQMWELSYGLPLPLWEVVGLAYIIIFGFLLWRALHYKRIKK